ncbi:GntR family transcriptional regulator [Microbacterium sp.]|uniref:GntR family transcriptional regulator n=1 Tax=Microbacterium sp. TaxID=51671 RepID=UPI002811042A|nr:GntR family transcriptional regulator [Microbacterium sp.]
MLLTIDSHSERPLFEQVAASVRTSIAAGRIRPGDRLPAAREIAAGLGINLHTVLRAFQDLRDEGLIELRRGRGAVITPAAGSLSELHADITALVARAAAMGLTPGTLAALVKEHSA